MNNNVNNNVNNNQNNNDEFHQKMRARYIEAQKKKEAQMPPPREKTKLEKFYDKILTVMAFVGPLIALGMIIRALIGHFVEHDPFYGAVVYWVLIPMAIFLVIFIKGIIDEYF